METVLKTKTRLTLDDFKADAPYAAAHTEAIPDLPNKISGLRLTPLRRYADARGDLVVLANGAEGATILSPDEPLVHTYRVTAAPGSVRAWVFHKRQKDRLAFTEGQFRIVLYDLRPDSPSFGEIVEVDAGQDNPMFVTIPECVVHGVKNFGPDSASFVNHPTRAFDRANPDKYRLPVSDPRVPYAFD